LDCSFFSLSPPPFLFYAHGSRPWHFPFLAGGEAIVSKSFYAARGVRTASLPYHPSFGQKLGPPFSLFLSFLNFGPGPVAGRTVRNAKVKDATRALFLRTYVPVNGTPLPRRKPIFFIDTSFFPCERADMSVLRTLVMRSSPDALQPGPPSSGIFPSIFSGVPSLSFPFCYKTPRKISFSSVEIIDESGAPPSLSTVLVMGPFI